MNEIKKERKKRDKRKIRKYKLNWKGMKKIKEYEWN